MCFTVLLPGAINFQKRSAPRREAHSQPAHPTGTPGVLPPGSEPSVPQHGPLPQPRPHGSAARPPRRSAARFRGQQPGSTGRGARQRPQQTHRDLAASPGSLRSAPLPAVPPGPAPGPELPPRPRLGARRLSPEVLRAQQAHPPPLAARVPLRRGSHRPARPAAPAPPPLPLLPPPPAAAAIFPCRARRRRGEGQEGRGCASPLRVPAARGPPRQPLPLSSGRRPAVPDSLRCPQALAAQSLPPRRPRFRARPRRHFRRRHRQSLPPRLPPADPQRRPPIGSPAAMATQGGSRASPRQPRRLPARPPGRAFRAAHPAPYSTTPPRGIRTPSRGSSIPREGLAAGGAPCESPVSPRAGEGGPDAS